MKYLEDSAGILIYGVPWKIVFQNSITRILWRYLEGSAGILIYGVSWKIVFQN